MTTLFVTFSGDTSTRFDRDYYLRSHMPLVSETYHPYGLQTASAFFPAGDGAGRIAIGMLEFRDQAALHAALASPDAGRLMADVRNFTDAIPTQCRAAPV